MPPTNEELEYLDLPFIQNTWANLLPVVSVPCNSILILWLKQYDLHIITESIIQTAKKWLKVEKGACSANGPSMSDTDCVVYANRYMIHLKTKETAPTCPTCKKQLYRMGYCSGALSWVCGCRVEQEYT